MKRLIKKLIRVILCLWCCCIFFIPKVKAFSGSVTSIRLNNNSMETTNYRSATANNNTLKFDVQTDGNPVYIRQIYCYDSKVVTWTQNLSSAELYNVIFYNTNKKCNYYNSTYNGGVVMYFYATYKPINSPSASVIITFNASSSMSMGLLASGISETPYEYVFSDPNQDVDVSVNTSGIESKQSETNEKLDDLNDNITNDDKPTNDNFDDVTLADDQPISNLVTLPITLLTAYYNSLNGSCSNYTLPFLFNNNVTIPCFTISDVVGSTVGNLIDMAICLFMVYELFLLFIRIFDGITTLSDTYTWTVKRGGR